MYGVGSGKTIKEQRHWVGKKVWQSVLVYSTEDTLESPYTSVAVIATVMVVESTDGRSIVRGSLPATRPKGWMGLK